MGNKAFKIFYACFMALVLVALVVFMTLHISGGLGGSYSKLMLAGYVLLIIWAGIRLYALIKEILQNQNR